MVDIIPFKGLVYNKEEVGDISSVVSPPYDVISPKMRQDLISFSRENIVNIILPQGDGEDKYDNASKALDDWMRNKVLVRDECNCFYCLRINFKTLQGEQSLSGFIGLTRIEDYGSGGVLRHEKTLSGPKEDRFKLLEKCRANFGLIYTIYKSSSAINGILEHNKEKKPDISIAPLYDKSLNFELWRVSDRDDVENITKAMSERQILIADGHHRYETSLMYRNKFPGGSNTPGPQDYVLTLFMDSSQDELKIYPTHRSLTFKKEMDIKTLIRLLDEKYDISPIVLENETAVDSMLDDLKNNNETGFLFHSMRGSYRLIASNTGSFDKFENPDVFVLHEKLLVDLDNTFGLKDISFNHSADQMIQDLAEKKSDLVIFLNPPTISDMEKICYSGGLMPQKSTYFWPKPCTGLVMYKL